VEEILSVFTTYGPYVGLALSINAIVWGLKGKVFKKFFDSSLGNRLGWMMPMLLGVLGGFLLPGDDPVKSKILTGLGLGAVSHIFYNLITKTLERKVAEIVKPAVEEVDKGGGDEKDLG
jgi:hypothetical protein